MGSVGSVGTNAVVFEMHTVCRCHMIGSHSISKESEWL